MKAQKLGLVLGINMAAACLVMQGCKATKPGKPVPSTPERPVITVVPAAPRTAPVVEPVVEPAVEPVQPVVAGQPAASQPSSIRTVKALPPKPAQKSPKKPKAKPASAPVATAAPAPAVTDQPAATTTEYVVKPGDTLFLISKRTNYRQDAIVAANPGLNPDRLRAGQKIKMPGAVAAPAVAKADKSEAKAAAKGKDKVLPAAAPSPAAANTKAPVKTKSGYVPYEGPTKDYVVKGGDSLGKIAGEYGISIRALKALNGLQKDSLRVGQKLKVPTEKQVAAAKKAPGATKDAVAKKDSVVKEAAAPAPKAPEAAKKAAAPAAPAAAADVAAPKPAEGAKSAEAAPVADAAKPVEEAKPAETPVVRTHVVKEGEDLVQIAIGYTISPSVLMDLNDLKATDEIKPGQVLKLPANAKVNVQ